MSISQFKSYEEVSFSFDNRITVFTGRNGSGKTNLLDAIWYLTTGKSYFNFQDTQLIHNDLDYFNLRGQFSNQDASEEVFCAFMKGKRRVIKRNGVAYTKLIAHYGVYPCVMIAPQDVGLMNDGNEVRRKWLDSVISLYDASYLAQIIYYEKLLEQRNALLRQAEEGKSINEDLLKVYNERMESPTEYIVSKRKDFFAFFNPIFNALHKSFCLDIEDVKIVYHSRLMDNKLSDLYRSSLSKDIAIQRTSEGIHKDNIEFFLGSNSLKKFGSQGQLKTFLFALKLSVAKYIEIKKGIHPIILLDDYCERLDENRLGVLSDYLLNKIENQVFITDTQIVRMRRIFEDKVGYVEI